VDLTTDAEALTAFNEIAKALTVFCALSADCFKFSNGFNSIMSFLLSFLAIISLF